MASFYDLTIGQHIEFLRILTGAGLTAEDGKSVIDDSTRAKLMIEALHKPPIYPLPDWYTKPQQQIFRVAEFLSQYGGSTGFRPDDIPPVPMNFVPRTSTEVLMLMVYLPYEGKMSGVRSTFDSLWDFVVPPEGYSKWRWDQLKSDSKSLRLLEGIEHRPGIRWIAFDPNANHGKSPQSCWDNPNVALELAGPEVLMALVLFAGWARSWNGNKSPYPNMAGYQLNWESAWQNCPYVFRRYDNCQLKLSAFLAYANDNWSCPSVRDY